MNQWGAVKLGLIVATAGGLGAMALPGASLLPRARARGMISGAAADPGRYAMAKMGAVADGLGAVLDAGGGASARAPGSPLASASESVRKMVRSASLAFEVKDQARARALVRAAAFRYGAEIESDEISGGVGHGCGVIVIKASPEKLDAILKELEPVGRVLSRSVSTSNMSEEYVDLKARLENSRKVERRLTELLAFKTNKLGDVLQVERELERVGQDIERTIGRMKYIDSLAASSRISVRLEEPRLETSQAPGVATDVRNALTKAFNTFVATGLALLRVTGFLLAIGLWTAPVAGGLWLLKRKFWS